MKSVIMIMVLEQLQTIYGPKVVPVQYPLATGPNFNSLTCCTFDEKIFVGT